jgi:LPXTG-motif cell wall-anchored protein
MRAARRTPPLPFGRMRRLVTLLIAASLLALPSAAVAQSAGDEQYSDPFGQVEQGGGGQGQQNQGQGQSQSQAPAPAEPAQTTVAPTTTADQAVASEDTTSPTLPRTGLNDVLFAVMGATLLLAGVTVRRLAS